MHGVGRGHNPSVTRASDRPPVAPRARRLKTSASEPRGPRFESGRPDQTRLNSLSAALRSHGGPYFPSGGKPRGVGLGLSSRTLWSTGSPGHRKARVRLAFQNKPLRQCGGCRPPRSPASRNPQDRRGSDRSVLPVAPQRAPVTTSGLVPQASRTDSEGSQDSPVPTPRLGLWDGPLAGPVLAACRVW